MSKNTEFHKVMAVLAGKPDEVVLDTAAGLLLHVASMMENKKMPPYSYLIGASELVNEALRLLIKPSGEYEWKCEDE